MNFTGAFIGDITGSVYEWNNAQTFNEIEIMKAGSHPTDDSVLTVAIMEWLMKTNKATTSDQREVLIKCLRDAYKRHPKAGYGSMFNKWAQSSEDEPTDSYGNGAAMRVSPCGFVADSLEEAENLAKLSAEVSHNHKDAIEGAQAIAAAIYMARTGHRMEHIRKYLQDKYNYDLDRSCISIHGSHSFTAMARTTVQEALIAFFEGEDFRSVLRYAIYVGGDSDTIAAMACAIAGAKYGISSRLSENALSFFGGVDLQIISDFAAFVTKCVGNKGEDGDNFNYDFKAKFYNAGVPTKEDYK